MLTPVLADGSGTINSEEELEMLCLNVVTRLQSNPKFKQLTAAKTDKLIQEMNTSLPLTFKGFKEMFCVIQNVAK